MSIGVIKRVDDLGRVVIPKEIRNALGIREGDALEIFANSEIRTVILKPLELRPDYETIWKQVKRNNHLSKELIDELEKQHTTF